MRSFDEINDDLKAAISINDSTALRLLAEEMLDVGTPQAKALALNALGAADKFTGHYPSAIEHYGRALALYDELDDRNGSAVVTGNMGLVFMSMGDYSSALEHFQRARANSEELGNITGSANLTSNMGLVYQETGDYPLALEHFRRALVIHEELDNRASMARVIGNIGIVHNCTGDNPSALEHYRRALHLYEELGDRDGVAIVTGNMGIVYHSSGDYPLALEHYQRALALHDLLGDRSSVALVTCNIGSIFRDTDDYASALEHYRRALTLYEELGNRTGVANSTGYIISALQILGQDDEAELLLGVQAEMIMDAPVTRALHFANRAIQAERSKDLDGAWKNLHQALDIVAEAGARAETAMYHEKLRELAKERNDFEGYVHHNTEYQRISEEVRGKEATQRMTMMQAERIMEAIEREREKERALLYSALPQSVAWRMLRGEDVSGDHFECAAVLFLDIVGFTKISDAVSPALVVHLLDVVFNACDDIVERHNVTKIKTIGDSYMAVAFPTESSGGEQRLTNSEQRAASAAIDMLNAITHILLNLPEGLRENLPKGLQVRIGLHNGPVVAGVLGTRRLQYDVWGDTVNVASRMESTSEPGRIHVSEAFARSLAAPSVRDGEDAIPSASEEREELPIPYSLFLRGEIEVKGKGMMTTYWLESTS